MGVSKLLLICCFPIYVWGQTSERVEKATLIELPSGYVTGDITSEEDVKSYLGIPYAAPPVGALRWQAPQPVEPWPGIRRCIDPPPSAMQPDPVPFYCWSQEFITPAKPMGEDCLYLNLWAPTQRNGEKLPVMVWIHGGALVSGSGMVPLYDGTEMARKGVIFITINYRLGIFGFLAHPELTADSELHTSGNYGILDQIAALEWVRDNIEEFGGDPNNVTIAGQSAGAFSVNMLMVSPLAKGLFHRAIAQSGGLFEKEPLYGAGLEAAEQLGKQLMDEAGLESLGDLRSAPVETLMSVQHRFGIVIDSVVIPPVYETFQRGMQNDVPLLTGWNKDDNVFFGPLQTAEEFRKNAEEEYGDRSGEYLEVFPAATDEEAEASQKVLSILFFGWNNYKWASMQTETGQNPAYLYYFTRVPPGEPDYGAFHSAEFAYALHTLHLWDRPFTQTDRTIEEIMSSYWVNFAKNGNPNSSGLPLWPSFRNEQPKAMQLGTGISPIPLPYHRQMKFLDELN